MRRLFPIFALLASSFSAFAELHVDVNPNGVIHVWGSAEVDDYLHITNVCNNSMGSCTNCVQISPEQMHAYKTLILSECGTVETNLQGIITAALEIYERMNQMEQDISSFQRIGPATASSVDTTYRNALTNYVYSVDNTQTSLVRSYISAKPWQFAAQGIFYNDGIYDYANNYVLPEVTASKSDAEEIVYQVDSARASVSSIKSTVRAMSEEACQGCSGGVGDGGNTGDGGGSCGDCPCVEQLDAIKDYVEHIDDDFHVQLENMADVTNFIPRMDSYAKLVSGILYNDATIVVDDGENSWSNVYHRGHSDLYDYDKSNILQRIELLVFGMTSISSVTNFDNVGDLADDSVDIENTINGVVSNVSSQHEDLSSDIGTIQDKIESLFDALNFFGSGSLSEFSLNDPYTLDHFGGYTFEVTSKDVENLAPYRNIVRTCFQVFYWVSGIAFMIFFWYCVVSFIVGSVLRVLRFFNNLLT